MKVRFYILFILAVMLASFGSCRKVTSAAAEFLVSGDTAGFALPAPLGSVSDFEKILTEEQIRKLDSIIVEYETKSDKKINIVTTKSFKPYASLNEYSADLLANWETDDVEKNTVMFVISEKLNEAEIIAGDNLKRKLTEKECKRIVKKSMPGDLKNENDFEVLETGLQKIIKEIR